MLNIISVLIRLCPLGLNINMINLPVEQHRHGEHREQQEAENWILTSSFSQDVELQSPLHNL